MKKKVIILISSILMVTNFYGCNENSKRKDKAIEVATETGNVEEINRSSIVESLNSEDKKKIVQDLYSVKDISEEEKKEKAKELFDEYINDNRTDWKMVENQKLNRKPVEALTDYKIGDIDLVKEEGNKYTVDISYDIKYTNESNMWVAGNGSLCEDNWDRSKCNFVDISRFGDKYIITDIYTG